MKKLNLHFKIYYRYIQLHYYFKKIGSYFKKFKIKNKRIRRIMLKNIQKKLRH